MNRQNGFKGNARDPMRGGAPKSEPPFPRQSQPWPGLAKEMSPRPDHGETTYVGKARLTGLRALWPLRTQAI